MIADWETIDRAPKDGTRIVGAVWSEKTRRWRCFDAYYAMGMTKPRWIFDGWAGQNAGEPTHWIKAPPKPEGE